ncbi:unnamed protein product [Ectocarpus sp. 12 AP-2014]
MLCRNKLFLPHFPVVQQGGSSASSPRGHSICNQHGVPTGQRWAPNEGRLHSPCPRGKKITETVSGGATLPSDRGQTPKTWGKAVMNHKVLPIMAASKVLAPDL